MSKPLRIVSINGSYSQPSKTAALIDQIVLEINKNTDAQHHAIEISALDSSFGSAMSRDELSSEVISELKAVESADFIIAASPVFRGSYTGLFKHFIDMVDQYALANKPVMLAATGGSDMHALMIEFALRPLFGILQAQTVPVSIYANSGDFDGQTILNPGVFSRIEMAVKDIIPLLPKAN